MIDVIGYPVGRYTVDFEATGAEGPEYHRVPDAGVRKPGTEEMGGRPTRFPLWALGVGARLRVTINEDVPTDERQFVVKAIRATVSAGARRLRPARFSCAYRAEGGVPVVWVTRIQ